MDLSIHFKDQKKNKIDNKIHTQKINFFFILNYLFRNLQEIFKILKLKTQILKKMKTQSCLIKITSKKFTKLQLKSQLVFLIAITFFN